MDDLVIAQQMITRGSKSKDTFHSSSFMYMTTNEKINLYQYWLQNKSKVLSVTSSGDQIFNSLLEGSLDIDAYDISRFPKYLVELKRAAFLALTREEFIDFFFVDVHKDEYYDDLYFKIRNYLDKFYRDFWDGLINFFDWSYIINSPLFSSQPVNLNSILDNNIYLANFNKMREIVSNANIKYITGNIFQIAKASKTKYDLINLSSIIYYVSHYNDLLHSLPLTEGGIALTYLYSIPSALVTAYPDCDFINFKNHNEGIMLYKK